MIVFQNVQFTVYPNHPISVYFWYDVFDDGKRAMTSSPILNKYRSLFGAQLDNLEAIFVAVGGGGLASGVAAYVKALHPEIKIFGVEPTGALHLGFWHPGGSTITKSKKLHTYIIQTKKQ